MSNQEKRKSIITKLQSIVDAMKLCNPDNVPSSPTMQALMDAIELLSEHKLVVPTVFGNLVAETAGDSDYPGIYTYLESSNADEYATGEIAVVEATPPIAKHTEYRLRLIYTEDDHDDYTGVHVYETTRKTLKSEVIV